MLKTYRGTFDDAKAGVLAVRQYEIVEYIVKNLATVGTGVLVFVSGMQDINELYGLLEDCLSMRSRKSKKFRVFAIHADISLEDQQEAFFPVCSDEIKVILATNAAESSITIPDVDIVIDMGIHKAMFFDEAHHRSYVRSTWISKASATQRAGRTGRTRPGEVYRLYSRELFEYLDEYSTAEVKRLPMQDVIIRLRYNFEQTYNFKGVVPILQSLIEPPSVDNIDRSFEILFNNSLITEPSDGGNLTVLGKFCSALPMDIRLGRLCVQRVAICLIVTVLVTGFRKIDRVWNIIRCCRGSCNTQQCFIATKKHISSGFTFCTANP